jgi:hypothetical protein
MPETHQRKPVNPLKVVFWTLVVYALLAPGGFVTCRSHATGNLVVDYLCEPLLDNTYPTESEDARKRFWAATPDATIKGLLSLAETALVVTMLIYLNRSSWLVLIFLRYCPNRNEPFRDSRTALIKRFVMANATYSRPTGL